MKAIASILTLLLMTLTTFANTSDSVFGNKSQLPKDLQVQMLDLITTQCPHDITPYGLSEIETKITAEDLGVESEIQYETYLNSRYLFDGTHPLTQQIKVLSSKRTDHIGKTVYTIHKLITDVGCEF